MEIVDLLIIACIDVESGKKAFFLMMRKGER